MTTYIYIMQTSKGSRPSEIAYLTFEDAYYSALEALKEALMEDEGYDIDHIHSLEALNKIDPDYRANVKVNR